jgi:hypothetical protein
MEHPSADAPEPILVEISIVTPGILARQLFSPGCLLAVIDLAQIQDMSPHHTAAGAAVVLDVRNPTKNGIMGPD